VVALVLAIVVLAGGFLVSAVWNNEPWDAYAEGWTELPLPPHTGSSTTYVWAGSRLMSWGGGTRDGGDAHIAYTLDPKSKTWSPTAPAPLGGQIWAAIWTGSEVLYFVGEFPPGLQVLGFDPERNAWETFDPSPGGMTPPGSFTWTGRGVIVFGGSLDSNHSSEQAWWFDPATGTWSPLPSSPIAMAAPATAWSGQQLIAAGVTGDPPGSGSGSLETVAYDPGSSSWDVLPASGLAADATGAVAVDGRPILWQPAVASSVEWQPTSRSWTP
jgi:Kelch motif